MATKSLPIRTGKLDVGQETNSQILELLDREERSSLQSDQRTIRRTIEYGHSFFKMEQNDFSIENQVPPFLQKFGDRICECLGFPPREFTNVILSEYRNGFHLEPHADVHSGSSIYNFAFEEEVFGVVIESDSTGHLYFVEYAQESETDKPPLNLPHVFDITEESGTIFCLSGPYRYEPYFHGVTDVTKRRISVTFRRVEQQQKK